MSGSPTRRSRSARPRPRNRISTARRSIAAAKAAGAEAIHPGYGFLAENADFAQAALDAGLVFIGPPPAAMRAMGDKSAAKARMAEAGVPTAPGYHGDDQNPARFVVEAERIGFPLMIKASAGGGGRGMRVVRETVGLEAALSAASAEARSAFGDGRLLMERALIGARHVEVQVFGDERGAIVHLGERDCSIQRRHQKIIEELPSPAVSPDLRARMGAAAVAAAAAVGYVGAGTVEFLLDGDGRFYFLEMNTRIQVEHPVTEAVTGLDLVRLQLQVAQGRPLPFAQADVTLRGHAIEARLCAEDAAANFMPATGDRRVAAGRGEGIRVDHGLAEGGAVTPFYDSMLAKIVALARIASRRDAGSSRAGGHARRGRRHQPRFPDRRARPARLRRGRGDDRVHCANAAAPAPAPPPIEASRSPRLISGEAAAPPPRRRRGARAVAVGSRRRGATSRFVATAGRDGSSTIDGERSRSACRTRDARANPLRARRRRLGRATSPAGRSL